ncbi:MAG TPA: PilZ domain-containing protein [Polyangiales bacterium]|nr:PilZ domain-containing protein [Polyangiales bacterium]
MTATALDQLRQPGASSAPQAQRVRRKARAYRRVSVRCGCWLEHEQATVFGTTVDLGRGGLFLRTALPMPPGVAVRVTLRLPGSETVVADGKVVRAVSTTEGDRPGLGVRFERLPEGEDSLRAFLFGNLESESELTEAVADTAT